MIEFKKEKLNVYIKLYDGWKLQNLEEEIYDFVGYMPGVGGTYAFSIIENKIYLSYYNWHGKKQYTKEIIRDGTYRADQKECFLHIMQSSNKIDAVLENMGLLKKKRKHEGSLTLNKNKDKSRSKYDFITDGSVEISGDCYLIKNASYCVEKLFYKNLLGYIVPIITSVYIWNCCDSEKLKEALLSF